MRRFYTLLPVAALFLVAGCRDVLVDPAAPVPQAPPASNDVPSIYLKGPTSLRVSDQGNYRAEMVQGVDHYEWHTIGDGGVHISFPYNGDTRLPLVIGHSVGSIELIVEAYDSTGQLMATAAKTVTIH